MAADGMTTRPTGVEREAETVAVRNLTKARRTSSMRAAFESMTAAARSARLAPLWTREEINDRC
jgi:hypothetical protein